MIRMPTLSALFLAVSLALFAAPAAAQAPGAAGLDQIELTNAKVENFIASYPDLEALSEKYKSEGDRDGPMGSIGSIARHQGAMAELNAILNRHGFSDITAWSRAAFSIMLAHNWDADNDPSGGIDKAIAEVNANKDMSDQHKQMIIAQLESQRETVKALKPLPGNIEVVRHHRDAIEAATEN